MKKLVVIILTLLLIVGGTGGFLAYQTHVEAAAAVPRPNIDVYQLWTLTNQERANTGLQQLKLNPALTSSAQAKCDDMVMKNYWDHVAPDGTRWDSFINAQIPTYYKGGENLAADSMSASQAVQGWMASPGHRANILTPEFTDVGYAVCSDAAYPSMVVQQFVALH